MSDRLPTLELLLWGFTLIGAVFVVIGVVIVVRAGQKIAAVRKLNNEGILTTGRVLHAEVTRKKVYLTTGGSDMTSSTAINPDYLSETVEFRTETGQVVRGTPRASDVGMRDRTGAEVAVRYDRSCPTLFLAPANADRFNIIGISGLTVSGAIFGLVGLLFIIASRWLA